MLLTLVLLSQGINAPLISFNLILKFHGFSIRCFILTLSLISNLFSYSLCIKKVFGGELTQLEQLEYILVIDPL